MNENSGLSASDVLALDNRGNGNDIMSGGYGLIWFIALLMMGNGGFGWGGNRENYVTDTDLAISQNALDNANQSQYILGQLGRFVAWAGSGSQAAAVAG